MKPKPGKALEDLVAAIESILCGEGNFEVLRNTRKQYERTPFAEFDVIVKGRAGSSPVYALFECRDRKNKAPNEWIHALANKKRFHGFTSVAAVSTSGFAKGCEAVAARDQIDLRTVSSLVPEKVLVGFEGITAQNFLFGIKLRRATFHFVHATSEALLDSARHILEDPNVRQGKYLFATTYKLALSINDCFWTHASRHAMALKEAWDNEGLGVSTLVKYGAPETLEFLTPLGPGKISTIRYYYEFDTAVVSARPSCIRNYVSQISGETISQTVEFEMEFPGIGMQTILLHAVPTNDATKIGLSLERQSNR